MKTALMILAVAVFMATNAMAVTCSEKTKARLKSFANVDEEMVNNKICIDKSKFSDDFINELLNRGLTPKDIAYWTEKDVTPQDLEALLNAKASPSAEKQFWSDWTIGIGLLRNDPPVVSDAMIVNGTIVRATTTQKYQTDFLLAKHHYFGDERTCSVPILGACIGLMITVGLGGNQFVDMLGAGFAAGFGKNLDGKDRQNQPHNIGIGWGRRFNVKTLGDGFVPNSPPPAGETQVRYQNIDINSPFFYYTYNFPN